MLNAVERWLTQSVQVKRLQSLGNNKEGWTVVETALPCMIQEFDASRQNGVAMSLFKPAHLYAKLTANLKEDDLIIDTATSRTYVVRGTIRREQGQSVKHLECLIEQDESKV